IEVYATGEDIVFHNVKHLPGKTKSDVQAVRITDSSLHFLPANIGANFRNIIALEVIDCGLAAIDPFTLLSVSSFKSDATVFFNLQELSLPDNNIEFLPENLFKFTKKLKIINFRYNRIKYIHQEILYDLNDLIFADFRNNVNIDEVYSLRGKEGVTLSVLNAKIALCCQRYEKRRTVPDFIHSLWEGDLSDFTIKTEGENFRVHKLILAANSPVFAAMFRQEMAENLINAENVGEIFQIGFIHNNAVIKKAALDEIQKKFTVKLPDKVMDSMEDMKDILKVFETINRL
ncbi:TD and POZ domain-containing protein 4, partial [Pseudolycoriella hygida]